MITILRKNNVDAGDNQKELEIRGLSGDTKPTTVNSVNIPNGTVFIEIDTGKMFLYDQQNLLWKEV